MRASAGGAVRARTDYFFVAAAAVIALVAFGGFAGTYWLQLPAGTFTGPGILHLHGLLFSAWTLFLLAQAWLGARRQLTAHRAWGVAGVSLATAMVFTGMTVAIRSIGRADAAGWGDGARLVFFTSVTSLMAFTGFVAAGLLNVRRPEWHKRLMMLSSYTIIGAALARILFHLAGGGGPGVRLGTEPSPSTTSLPMEIASEGVGLLLIAVGMLYDWRTRGRPHPAYAVGAAVLIGVSILRATVGPSPAWRAVADAFVRFAG